MNILDRPDLQPAARAFAYAFARSREHSAIVADALQRYGEKGPMISGIAQDHFPQPIKTRLRALCSIMNQHYVLAGTLRPPGVRGTTMHKLRHAVRMRYGCGFYL